MVSLFRFRSIYLEVNSNSKSFAWQTTKNTSFALERALASWFSRAIAHNENYAFQLFGCTRAGRGRPDALFVSVCTPHSTHNEIAARTHKQKTTTHTTCCKSRAMHAVQTDSMRVRLARGARAFNAMCKHAVYPFCIFRVSFICVYAHKHVRAY